MQDRRKDRRAQTSERLASPRSVRSRDQETGRRTFRHLALLAALSLALYAQVLRNGFVTDDLYQLQYNTFIRSYHYIPKLFTTSVWQFLGAKNISNYYRPLQMLFYMAEYHAFAFRTWPYHLANILLNLAAVFAAYLLVRALADDKLAFWAALLWALHPIHVEVVAWIAAVPELLCAIAFFTAVRLYLRARGGVRPSLNHALASAVFFAGMFCKETILVLPAVLLAYEFFYRRESTWATVLGLRRLLPYLCALGIYLTIRIRILGSFAPGFGGEHPQFTRWQTLLSVPVVLCHYIFKVFWPAHLNYFYDFTPENTLGWKFVACVALIAVLVVAMFLLRKAQPLLAFAVAWFFITIAPVLSISNVGENVFTERYLYIPSFGFSLFAGWVWLRVMELTPRKRKLAVAYPALAVVLLFWAVLIVDRVPEWRSDVTLDLSDAVRFSNSPRAQTNLGIAYSTAGQMDLAMPPLERALALDPYSSLAHLYMAISLSALGDGQEARSHLLQAEQYNKKKMVMWSLFGQVYANLKEWDRAIEYERRQLELEPENPVLYTTLGEALQADGQTEDSIAAFRRAIQLEPGAIDASTNLAITLAEQGDTDEAISILTSALRIHPDGFHAEAGWFNLGNIYAHKTEWKAAAYAYQHALDLNPDLSVARQRLGSVEAEQAVQRH